jgi:hypothetical protein
MVVKKPGTSVCTRGMIFVARSSIACLSYLIGRSPESSVGSKPVLTPLSFLTMAEREGMSSLIKRKTHPQVSLIERDPSEHKISDAFDI